MTYKGKFRPRVPKKYRGDYTNIIYRSSWELKFMKYCDTNKNILEWGSEEFFIPYMSPIDNRVHKYFPDFYIKVRESTGQVKKYVIEIKPKKQCIEPKVQKRKTKYINQRHLIFSMMSFLLSQLQMYSTGDSKDLTFTGVMCVNIHGRK
jgi:hypothetical protein